MSNSSVFVERRGVGPRITIDFAHNRSTMERPLAPATLLGRHYTCTWSLPDPAVPLFWVELRWFVQTWGWRLLADSGNTKGPLTPLSTPHWRAFGERDRIATPEVAITLTEGGPPQVFATDLIHRAPIDDASFDELVVARADGYWPADAEERAGEASPLVDGDVFVSLGRVLQFSDGVAVEGTDQAVIHLGRDRTRVYLDHIPDDEPRLSILDGDAEVVVQGAYVRVIQPYLEARQADPDGGWLTVREAHQRWVELGGSPDSSTERIAQDRSRLCRALARSGVVAAHTLFETRRQNRWRTRLTVPPERLVLG